MRSCAVSRGADVDSGSLETSATSRSGVSNLSLLPCLKLDLRRRFDIESESDEDPFLPPDIAAIAATPAPAAIAAAVGPEAIDSRLCSSSSRSRSFRARWSSSSRVRTSVAFFSSSNCCRFLSSCFRFCSSRSLLISASISASVREDSPPSEARLLDCCLMSG